MQTFDIKARIRAYITRVVRNVELNDDYDILDNGIVNSLFAVELVAFSEQEFDITIDDEDLEIANFATINALGYRTTSVLDATGALIASLVG